MLTPPDGLPEDLLVATLDRCWSLEVASLAYRPVGFGSHHWEVVDGGHVRWFVTVDDLAAKRRPSDDPLDAVFDRLRAALGTAVRLRADGRPWVVAPVPVRDGEPLVRLGARFGCALYPHLVGESYDWGEFETPEHRWGVLDRVVSVHAAPAAVRGAALVDDFAIPHRDELESGPRGDDPAPGPYAEPATALLVEYAAPLRRLLARYDELVTLARAEPDRMVLTHGEPHRGNTMRVDDEWVLIDWETVLIAPPERDLWLLDPGDGSVLDAYAEATGSGPLDAMVELYQLRWHLADIAVEVKHFRRPHGGSADDDRSFEVLRGVLAHIADLPLGTVP